MFITKGLLEHHEACKSQVDKFVELFPDGVVPTRDLCSAHAQTFNFDWACRLLSPPALEAYNETLAPARKVYDDDVSSARKVCYEACASASKVYDEAIASARKAFDETVGPAGKVYDETVAAAWFDASQLECEEVGRMAEKDTGE